MQTFSGCSSRRKDAWLKFASIVAAKNVEPAINTSLTGAMIHYEPLSTFNFLLRTTEVFNGLSY